jgi:hypothetical protein
MDYKVLVNVFVPEIEQSFEFYVPVNKHIELVIKIINKAISDLTFGQFPQKDNLQICNRRTGQIYDNGYYVRNTDIKNGTQLVLF